MKTNKISVFFKAIIPAVFIINGSLAAASGAAGSVFKEKSAGNVISIPAEGNAWVVENEGSAGKVIGKGGIRNWNDSEIRFRIWFNTEKIGIADISLNARVPAGKTILRVTLGKVSKEIRIGGSSYVNFPTGKFRIEKAGYQCVELQGIKKDGPFFADIESIKIGGTISGGRLYFVRDDFYWGRRGPSVHLNFQVPDKNEDISWFYNEITVPEGNDVQGSYFMANGFAQGYFGIQVNSLTERRVLFSIWSPYKTDNPGEIPEKFRIRLLKKGEAVHAGEFGNEGSGGQSYLKFYWKSGNTYRFLLRALPSDEGYTDFTAWFFAPEIGSWQLIASFRRPETKTYLKNLYSFLENFSTETGNIPRMGLFGNQWICNSGWKWTELTRIKFTADATAKKEARLDYAGGSDGKLFFLKNCGFFSENTVIDTWFDRMPTRTIPSISFDDLP